MTKAQFAKFCETSNLPPRIAYGRRGWDWFVLLKGSWGGSRPGRCLLSERALSRPKVQDHSHEFWKDVKPALEAAAAKYLRWLADWDKSVGGRRADLNPPEAIR